MVRISAIVLYLILVACVAGDAQSQPESSSSALVLQSTSGTSKVEFPPGATIGVKYTIDPRTFKGMHINEVLENAVILNGDTVELQYIERITARKEGFHRAGNKLLLWSLFTVLAFLLVLSLSAILLFQPILLGVMLVILFIPLSLAFPTGIILGIVFLAIAHKTYRLTRDWTASTRVRKP
jgi:hypothetical protein